jgi:tetratricopeptide (TPR) repeat protein
MFRNKRDVDRHVAELEERIPDVKERALKYFTIARLYQTVGEADLALKYLDKYCEVRTNSPQAYKFRGGIFEYLAERGPQEQAYVNKRAAFEAYKTSYELDLSQKELLIKICDLLAQLPIRDTQVTR